MGERKKESKVRESKRPEEEEDKVKVDKEKRHRLREEFPVVERDVQVFVDWSICVTQQRTEGDFSMYVLI